jgi:hypothetical protein
MMVIWYCTQEDASVGKQQILDLKRQLRLSNSSGFQRVNLVANGHGGARKGAGRKPGTGWLPAAKKLRSATVTRLRAIVGSEKDPLNQVVDMVLSDDLDIQTRLNAAAICLPYLYPRLSATTVDSRSTVVQIDGNALIAKINARLERLAEMPAPTPSEELLGISDVAA